jgi:hypothetical protein
MSSGGTNSSAYVEVSENENVGKEIISDEASADIENAFSESTIDQTSQDMSTEIENATVSSESELYRFVWIFYRLWNMLYNVLWWYKLLSLFI